MAGSKVLLVVRILIAHITMTLKIVATAGTKLSDHDCFYHHRHHHKDDDDDGADDDDIGDEDDCGSENSALVVL